MNLLADATNIISDAVFSGAWLYPILGILFSLSHASIAHSLAPLILKFLLTAFSITTAAFFFTYLPLVAFCAMLGPFAFAAAATMVLGEAYVLTMRKNNYAVNAVFRIKGIPLVHVERKSRSRGLLKSLSKPLRRFSREGILRYIVSLPLNLVPGLGTILFLLYNGAKSGPAFHSHYFQSKSMGPAARDAFVTRRKGSYLAFGTSALALGLIPVIGPVFTLSSTVGAALWACEMEMERTKEIRTDDNKL